MNIDKNQIYTSGDYTFQNFISLTEEQILSILEWRNNYKIRKFMYNTDLISKDNHLRFVSSLGTRDDIMYWLVLKNNTPIGVANLTNIDYNKSSAEPGCYMIPEMQDSGLGLDFFYNILRFVFNDEIDCHFLHGNVHRSNINALLINEYIGYTLNEEDIRTTDSKYIRITYDKKNFINKKDCNNIFNFVKFVRKNKYKYLIK